MVPRSGSTALQGAEVLFYPTAIGWHPQEKKSNMAKHGAWMSVMKGHAVANGVYVAAVLV
jgi:N-carbamoylputrescine amidase